MKKTSILLGTALIAGLFSSCLKDDFAIDPDKTNNVVEFINPSAIASPEGSVFALYSTAFETADAVDYPIVVSYSGADVAPSDITVNLTADPTAVDKYNTEQETEYTSLPSTLYTLPASVTIPKGQRRVTVPLKIRTNGFDFSLSYALPVKIASTTTGTVSGNFGTILLSISAKNKYDGLYNVTATAPMVDVVSSALTGFYPMNLELQTLSANTVVLFDPENFNGGGSFIHPIKSGTTISGYGNFSPIFTMDDAGNVTSVTNYFGSTNPSNRNAKLDPTGVNKFTVNGNTKTLEVKYIMTQGGADRTTFTEKWTFTGAR